MYFDKIDIEVLIGKRLTLIYFRFEIIWERVNFSHIFLSKLPLIHLRPVAAAGAVVDGGDDHNDNDFAVQNYC